MDGSVGMDILAEFRSIDIDMDYTRLRSIMGHIAGHTVIETHTDGYEQIGTVGVDIGAYVAVHAEHTLIERMIRGYRRQAKQSRRYGNSRLLGQRGKLLLGSGYHHAVSGKDHGSAGGIDHSRHRGQVVGIGSRIRMIAPYIAAFLVFPVEQGCLRVLGEVKHYRAGSAGRGDVKSPGHCPWNILGPADLIRPFGDRLCDTYHIGLLK